MKGGTLESVCIPGLLVIPPEALTHSFYFKIFFSINLCSGRFPLLYLSVLPENKRPMTEEM